MVGIRLQDWPYIKTALGKCNLFIKSNIYRINGATQPGRTAHVSEYIDAMSARGGSRKISDRVPTINNYSLHRYMYIYIVIFFGI